MAFFVKRQNSCCGCFSVKAGTLIIMLLISAYAILKMRILIEITWLEVFPENEFVLESHGFPQTTLLTSFEWIMWIFISYALVFQLLPCILALYGAYSRKTSYLQPFILINTANVVNLLGSLLALAGMLIIVCINRSRLEDEAAELVKFYNANKNSFRDPWPEDANKTILTGVISVIAFLIILLGVFTLILYHFVCVVHSYYLKLKEEKEGYKYNAFSDFLPENGKKPLV